MKYEVYIGRTDNTWFTITVEIPEGTVFPQKALINHMTKFFMSAKEEYAFWGLYYKHADED